MLRPQQKRKIVAPPLMQDFKPFGTPCRKLELLTLQYDDYEAIRLLDIEGDNVDFGRMWYSCRKCNKLIDALKITYHVKIARLTGKMN